MKITKKHRSFIVLVTVMLTIVVKPEIAHAFTCDFPGIRLATDTQETTGPAEELRSHSIAITQNLAFQMQLSQGKVVVGQFHRNSTRRFLHEAQVDEIQSLYWPPSDETEMPNNVEYSYLGAYRFEGHEISGGVLIPFSADKIDTYVTVSSDYSGVVDVLPNTDQILVGFLKKPNEKEAFRLTTAICPTYFSTDPDQLADLLECIKQGECEFPS